MSFLNKDELKKKGEEFIRKMKKNYEFFSKSLAEKDNIEIHTKGDIPKLAVLLGLLDPFYYDLYKLANGKDINTIADTLGLDKDAVKIFVDKLVKNGLIETPPE